MTVSELGAGAILGALLSVAACGGEGEKAPDVARAAITGVHVVQESTITASFEAAGVADPLQRATLSTKLMGSVVGVSVHEGDRVAKDQPLVRIDARDIDAKRAQVEAGIAAAEAVYQDALTQAKRFRALYADSAATRYQLDQVETGLARAESGLQAARASRAELDAVGAYAEVRSPFSGVVTRRFVDPGAFVAPGAPLVEVQDASSLRVSVSVPPRVAAILRRGQRVEATIEGRLAAAVVEGVVPSPAGAVYTVNAVVPNPRGDFLPGSAATLRIPAGERLAVMIPSRALVREGDLVGVRVETASGVELRWVKAGSAVGDLTEIYAGLQAGDRILTGGE
ncbi:MAG: efflux RND transporter periplasmic adaptor subunit [Gemmatimonadota bacterium]|nr:efflux RND transporter periplasmic adaptor subunit [Gemmatimonadota bacterium]